MAISYKPVHFLPITTPSYLKKKKIIITNLSLKIHISLGSRTYKQGQEGHSEAQLQIRVK